MKLQTSKNVIYLTDKEAEQIKQMILDGDKYILIGKELINSAFIEGIFEGENPNYDSAVDAITASERLISAPAESPDKWEKIKETIEEIKRKLIEKKIF